MKTIKLNPSRLWQLFVGHKVLSFIILILLISSAGYFYNSSKKSTSTYQTSKAELGSLISSISSTGTITSGDTTYVTTGASGTVSRVFVKNGDTVKKDQKIAEIDLDESGQGTQTTAWNNYLVAKANVSNAVTDRDRLDIKMWQDRQEILDTEEEYNNMKAGAWNPKTNAEYTYNEKAIVEKNYAVAKNNFNTDQEKYLNANSNISLAQAKSLSAYRSYQKVSSTVYAPESGVINNLVLAPGVVLGNSSAASSITVSTGTDSTSNSSSVASQKIAAIKNPIGKYQATVNLTEVDVTKVKSDQKVALTLDAFPDNNLTGTVLAVNTSGSVNSGVTSYTATILLDKTDLDIYTNMAVSANIVTSSVSDKIIIPSSAITTQNGQSTVQILKNGSPTTVQVTIALTNDVDAAIETGITEGDLVITSTSSKSSTKKSSSQSTSVFGNTRGGFGMPL